MTNGFDEFLNATGKAVEVFPKLYDDGLQATVQETGKILARIPRAINAAFSSLDIWIENKGYNVEATKKLLAKNLENVDPDKIVAPEAYVAVPALQAISYSMDSEELRNLYANLLAKSMQVDTKDSVHPSFVDIIKQLSPMDANMLKSLAKHIKTPNDILPIIRIFRIKQGSASGKLLKQHILGPEFYITKENLDSFELSIDNLMRLNLISVYYNESVAQSFLYDQIKNTRIVKNLEFEIESSQSKYCMPYIENGLLCLSPFGTSFINTCVS